MNQYQMEKKKINIEKLASKLKNLNSHEKEKFICKLKQEIRLLNAKLNVEEAVERKLDNIPSERKMTNSEITATIIIHTVLGGVLGGTVFSELSDSLLSLIMTIGAAGALGFIASLINGVAYESKPVSNKINDFRKFINDKRISRIEDKIELKEHLRLQLEDNSDVMSYLL